MRKLFMILASCAAFALVITTPAHAQLPGSAIRARIPFEFNVRGKTLPGGEYEIRRVTDAPETLEIYNRSNHKVVVFATDPVQTKSIAQLGELVFHRYGDTYFLYEIWTPSEIIGRELLPSRAERRLERETARANTKPETVALAVE